MATNPPKGDGHRNGAVRQHSQTKTPAGNWVKRDAETGQFMDVKISSVELTVISHLFSACRECQAY